MLTNQLIILIVLIASIMIIQNAFNCDTSNLNDLSILHINERSISANYNNIIDFIDSIHKQFSIIIITDTWLNDSNNKLYNLSDYNLTGINRSTYRGDGVLLYVSKYIDFESIDELCYTNKEICDMCTIKFKLKN